MCVVFIAMLLIIICAISISIIKPDLFVKFLNGLSKIDAVTERLAKTDYYILELTIGMGIFLSVSFYEYPIWVSLDLPLWFLLWDFFVSLSYHITIFLMYHFAIFIKYKFVSLNQLIASLYDDKYDKEVNELNIVDLYRRLQEIVDIFNKIFEMPFICYLLYLILLISNMINTILSGRIFAGISMTLYETVRSLKSIIFIFLNVFFSGLCSFINYFL